MNQKFFCIAEGSDQDGWQAICLDLDIAVQADTLQDVQTAMNLAIRSYVRDACGQSLADRDRLLSRRVPLWVRLGYAFKLACHSLVSKHRDGDLQASFEIPCLA